MKGTRVWIVAVSVLLACNGLGIASDWPHWRGPSLDGSTDEQGLPQTWSETENIAWKAPLPGPGAGTPVTADGKVFISSMDDGGNDLLALGFDIATGKELWRRIVAQSDRTIPRSTLATPSATTDGKQVYFIFGTGHLAAFDLDGNLVWSRHLEADYGNLACQFGYGSSPLLSDGKLIIQVLRRDRAWREPREGEPFDSFLLAVDPATGENLWRQERPQDAVNESMDSYASPILYTNDGRTDIVVMGADYITGHDPATGAERWRYGYATRKSRNWRTVASPVSGEGLIFASLPRGNNGLVALKPAGEGMLSDESVAWRFDGPTPDVSIPLLYQGNLYVLDGAMGRKVLSCLDPKTGQVKWQGQLGGRGPWRASMTAADGKIYCLNESGEAIVLAANDTEFRVLSRIAIDGTPLHASVAIAEGRLFIRTAAELICIGR